MNARSEMPIKVRKVTNAVFRADLSKGTRISLRTMVPPSPFLPRLMASHAYATVTSITRVQTISERMPITFASVGFVLSKFLTRKRPSKLIG